MLFIVTVTVIYDRGIEFGINRTKKARRIHPFAFHKAPHFVSTRIRLMNVGFGVGERLNDWDLIPEAFDLLSFCLTAIFRPENGK